ncbi:MAG: 50S ribosomal protein L35 [Planctomycetes bacterium]|nr:50S ribosomal protein L35 [Planctomycetota bacterium]
MPKIKTNKSARKRFKITKKGKVRRMKAGKRHLLSHKSAKRKRSLRRPSLVEGRQVRSIKRLLGKA